MGGDTAQGDGSVGEEGIAVSKGKTTKKKKKKNSQAVAQTDGCGWSVDTARRGCDEGLTQCVGCQQRQGINKEWGVNKGWGCGTGRWGQLASADNDKII